MKTIIVIASLILVLSAQVGFTQNFTEQQILNNVYATQQVFAYDGSGNVEYIGRATPGTATSAAGWQIQKITYSGSDAVNINFAGGSALFSLVWNSRTTYTY